MATPVPVQLGADVGAWVAIDSPMVQPGMDVAVKGHDRVYGPMPVRSSPAQVAEPEVPPVASSQPAGVAETGPTARVGG
jgi:hypothetical protein